MTDEDIVKAAKKCLHDYEDRESDNIKRAKEAIQFRAGDQWPERLKMERENPNQDGGSRPCPVLDKTNQYIRQIVNEERQTRAAIRIRPVDDDADPKTAEILNGLIRHIEYQSEATEAYANGGEQAIDGGFGYWRILADYCDPMSFDQDIRIKRINNRFSVALGPHSECDGSDAKEGLIYEDIQREDFKADYPKAKDVPFDGADDWSNKDTIRIAEYMRIEYKDITIHQLSDGTVLEDDKYQKLVTDIQNHNLSISQDPNYLPTDIPTPNVSRETKKPTVKWYKVTGEEVLEKRDLVGSYIPIVKVIGNEITMPDGKTRVSGAIDSMMDPQRLHNYAHAGFIEHVALAPRAPWLAEENQVKGYENEYGQANRKPITLLKYKATTTDDGALIPAPQRTPPAGIAPGWQQMLMNTEQGIASAIGMYGASVGAQMDVNTQERSGIALIEQKTQGMIGNYHYPDNLNRSIQQTGKILLEWIPHYYDTARTIRIIGESGDPELVKINPQQDESVAEEKDAFNKVVGKIYNLNVGKYDVTVATGPSYTAKRQEAADNEMKMMQLNPDLIPLIGDLVFRNMDWPDADKIANRLKTRLPPEILQMESDGEVDPQQMMIQKQLEMLAQQIEQKAQELDDREKSINNEFALTQASTSEMQAQKKALDSDQRIFKAYVGEEIAKLQLMGEKMINQLKNAVNPLVNELKEKAKEPGDSQMEQAVDEMEDNILAETIQNLQAYQSDMISQITNAFGEAMDRMAATINQPRVSEIQYDEQGNPVGSVSRVQ